MSEIEAVAKAVEKTAEFGTQSLQTAEKAGSFVSRIFKEPIDQAAGMLTDWLKFQRLKRLVEISDKVDRILRARGVIETRAVPPKVAFRMLDGAAVEDDPTLRNLWANLIANAMDPGFTCDISPVYADIVSNLSPLDVRILLVMYAELVTYDRASFDHARQFGFDIEPMCASLGISRDDYLVSVHSLIRQECVAPAIIEAEFGGMGGFRGAKFLTVDKGADSLVLTPLGIRFIEACSGGEGSYETLATEVATMRDHEIRIGGPVRKVARASIQTRAE